MKILELMGNSLLTEEYFFIGFLPLQSYIDETKTIKNGSKCPSDKEMIVRSLLLRHHIETLNCTFEDIKVSESSEGKDP